MNSNDIITEKAKIIAMKINTILRENGVIEYGTLGEIVKLFKTFHISYPWDMVTALFKAGCIVKQLNKDAKIIFKINTEKPAYYRIMEGVYMAHQEHNKKRRKDSSEVVKQPVTIKTKRVSNKITTANEAIWYFAEMEKNVMNALQGSPLSVKYKTKAYAESYLREQGVKYSTLVMSELQRLEIAKKIYEDGRFVYYFDIEGSIYGQVCDDWREALGTGWLISSLYNNPSFGIIKLSKKEEEKLFRFEKEHQPPFGKPLSLNDRDLSANSEVDDLLEIQRLKEELSRVDNIRNQYHEALEIIGFDFDNRTFPFYDVLDQNIAKHGDTMILEYLKYRGYKVMKPVKYEEV